MEARSALFRSPSPKGRASGFSFVISVSQYPVFKVRGPSDLAPCVGRSRTRKEILYLFETPVSSNNFEKFKISFRLLGSLAAFEKA